MFYDESRFGLITDIGRKWTAKGVKPIIPYQYKYKYLKYLNEKFKNDDVVLIMDNATFHKSKQFKIPKNIKIYYLPPYSQS